MTRGDSKPERQLIAALERAGLENIENAPKDVLGKPDVVVRRGRVHPLAVFVDGCYWHGCPQHYKPPRKRRASWLVKVTRALIRDRGLGAPCVHCGDSTGLLVERGWVVVRVWEHEVTADVDAAAQSVLARARSQEAAIERLSNRVRRAQPEDVAGGQDG